MRHALIRCNFPIQRLDAIKGGKRRKENVLAPLDGSKTLRFHTYGNSTLWENETTHKADISYLDFSKRFRVARDTYGEHFNIFGASSSPRNAYTEVSCEINAYEFRDLN